MLLTGVLVVVFLYSIVVGVLAMRRLALGFLGLAIFAGIGLAAALTRHDATASYAVPTLFGAARRGARAVVAGDARRGGPCLRGRAGHAAGGLVGCRRGCRRSRSAGRRRGDAGAAPDWRGT